MGRINVLMTKKIKEAIEEEPTRAQEIIDAEVNLGICVTDEKGDYTYVNQRYNEIYGYAEGELEGQSFMLVVPPENHAQLKTAHDMFIKNEYEIVRYWEVVKKGGERIQVQAAAAFFNNIFGSNGKGRKVTFVYYDA
ncbi:MULTISPECIES: PAS domain-containing protein [unclassified Carboxylicivirga]|uniref:PAS domain-containing protein n=1 Tax=Carboxylicivirga TaxID=1628153 RepID=UPI003D32BB1E